MWGRKVLKLLILVGLVLTPFIAVSSASADISQTDCSVSPSTYNANGTSTWTLTIHNTTGSTIRYVDAGEQIGPSDVNGSTSLAISDPLNVWTSVPPQLDQSWDSWAYNSTGINNGSSYSFSASMLSFNPTSVTSFFLGLYNDVPSGNPVEVGYCNVDTSAFTPASVQPPPPPGPTTPVITLPSSGSTTEGGAISATGSFNDVNTDAPWTATVDYGDGTGVMPLALNGNQFTLNHAYGFRGTYTITVSVTNGSSLTGTATDSISILPGPNGLTRADCSISPGYYNPSGASSWILHINNNTGDTIRYADAGGQIGSPVGSSDVSLSIADPLNVWTSIPPANQGWDSWAYNSTGIANGSSYDFAVSMPGFNPLNTYFLWVALYNDVPSGNPVEVGYCDINTLNLPPNAAPSLGSLSGATINEGASYTASGSFTDSDSTSWSATVDYGDESGPQPLTLSGTNFSLNHTYKEEGSYTVKVSVTDNQGASGSATAVATVNNAPFTVSAISAPTTPQQLVNGSASVSASATFSDPGVLDTHTATWNWGDGTTSTGTVTESNGSGSVADSHSYSSANVYTITLTVTDDDNISNSKQFMYVSVYNPTPQGLFTGVRTFDSPAGADTAQPSLTGKAQFGISVKYDQSGNPTGHADMNFSVGNINFKASALSLLVISNGMATLRGTGTINNTGSYTFLASGIDGHTNGGQDLIRFQIKDNSGNVVYDSQLGAADTVAPTTQVTGQVIVH